MRRAEKEIIDRSEIDQIVGQARVCRLGLSDGTVPYVVPVNFGYDGDHVYFHSAKSGMKIDFLEANPHVCFEFEHGVEIVPNEDRACGWGTEFESVIGWGTASEVTAGEEKAAALVTIMKQYGARDWQFCPDELNRVRVWRVRVERVTGKRSRIPRGSAAKSTA